jgi:hypothetical protein
MKAVERQNSNFILFRICAILNESNFSHIVRPITNLVTGEWYVFLSKTSLTGIIFEFPTGPV